MQAVLYGSDPVIQKLYIIDESDASVVEVGSFGISEVDGYMAGLAYDTENYIMYGTTTATNKLYSIDYTTASATLIGDMNVTLIHGLAYDNSTDTLLGTYGSTGGDGLYRIDTNTGHATLIGNIGHFYNDPRDSVSGLAIHPTTNDLYGVIGGPSSISALVRIDKVTGSGTLLHEYDIPNLSGLAFLPDGTLYATNNWSGGLYTLDIVTGSTQLIGYTGLDNALGLTVVPEPTTLLLLGLGGVVLRRRKNEASQI